jgi:hypothetical protein
MEDDDVRLSPEERVLRPDEAADVLGVQPSTLAHWRKVHSGPAYVRLGSGPRSPVGYQLRCLRRWLKEHTVQPAQKETAAG